MTPARLASEIWQAVCDAPVHSGQQVKVTGIQGLVLQVQALAATTKEETP